jgi:hypothetical protein
MGRMVARRSLSIRLTETLASLANNRADDYNPVDIIREEMESRSRGLTFEEIGESGIDLKRKKSHAELQSRQVALRDTLAALRSFLSQNMLSMTPFLSHFSIVWPFLAALQPFLSQDMLNVTPFFFVPP